MSSEVSITVQTSHVGTTREWQVRAWVVECQDLCLQSGLEFRVTLLFSELPQGLSQVLSWQDGFHSNLPDEGNPNVDIFGLN